MIRRKFKLSHSLFGIALLLLIEATLLWLHSTEWFVLIFAAIGALAMLYVATEIIEEVRGAAYMLTLLFAVVVEFVAFFAFQYWFMLGVSGATFPSLTRDPISLTLHSTMIFVFNPLYLPGTPLGQALLLINTLAALGLVLFILQNIWQIRR